jgi:hypothetical protein
MGGSAVGFDIGIAVGTRAASTSLTARCGSEPQTDVRPAFELAWPSRRLRLRRVERHLFANSETVALGYTQSPARGWR